MITDECPIDLSKVEEFKNSKSFKDIQNLPVQKLRNVKLKSNLSRTIRDQNGLVGASIIGTQQTGKSSYAMLVMHELYRGDIDQMFAHTVFGIKGLIDLLNNAAVNRERMICVLWDDASVSGSAGMYNIQRKLVQYLSAIGDTLGIVTKGLILTSPSGDLIKAFRNYNFYKIQIGMGRHKYDRYATAYQKGISPYGQTWYSRKFRDRFDVRLPFYDDYYKLREQLSISTLQSMDNFLKGGFEEETKKPHVPTIKERVQELRRDWDVGVFGDMTLKDVFKSHKINYLTAKNYM